jgi:hypothetical protein
VSVCIYSLFVLSCVGSGLADPPSKESNRLAKIKKSEAKRRVSRMSCAPSVSNRDR